MIIKINNFPTKKIKPENKEFNNIISSLENEAKWKLIIGEVQSGKTWAIIKLVEEGIKQKYNHIFVLGGFNKLVWSQTIERFQDVFGRRFWTTMDDLRKNESTNNSVLSIILKSRVEMELMESFISNILQRENKVKILIIDDEADYASINTSSHDDPSSINKSIHNALDEIKQNAKCGGLISITATPNALLVSNKHKFELDEAWVLGRNIKYTGLNYFNNQENFYLSLEDLKNKIKIDEYEIAIYIWLLKTYLYFQDEESDKKSDLLVYADNTIIVHKDIKNRIEKIISFLKINDQKEELFLTIINLLNLSIDINNFIEWLNDNLENNLLNEVLIFNSKLEKDSLFEKYNDFTYNLKIIVGGNFLSRGFTFQNLLTELFTYSSKTSTGVDTLLQRCRWFGYRTNNNKHKYMNVITTNKIIEMLEIAIKYNDVFNYSDVIHSIDINNVRKEILEIHEEYKNLLGATNK